MASTRSASTTTPTSSWSRHAIEELFKVDVINVTVSTTKAKEKSRNRRRGRVEGWTSPWKKAVVTLASGQKIEFFEGI